MDLRQKATAYTVALPGARRRSSTGTCSVETTASLHLLAVVDGGQFLELGQRAQGRGLGLTRAATAGGQGQGGHRYSGEGDQLNELLHRKCVNAGRESQGRLPASQGKTQARGHKSVTPGLRLKHAYFPGTTTFGGAVGAGALRFDAQDASAKPVKAARTATILESFMVEFCVFQADLRNGEHLPDDQRTLSIISQVPHSSEARDPNLSRKRRPRPQGRPPRSRLLSGISLSR